MNRNLAIFQFAPVWYGINIAKNYWIGIGKSPNTHPLQWRHMGAKGSQITSHMIVYSTVYSGADQRKHQSSASLAFARGIRRSPVNSPHKGTVTWKMFRFDDVIIYELVLCLTWEPLNETAYQYPTSVRFFGYCSPLWAIVDDNMLQFRFKRHSIWHCLYGLAVSGHCDTIVFNLSNKQCFIMQML